MIKEELLEKIESKELARLNSLSFKELIQEVCEWFNDEILECESRGDITNDYMEDFMRYRQEDSMEELVEVLNNYK